MEVKPLVGVIMGSKSDWETMRHAAEMLESFGVPYEKRIVSAHRTPGLMAEYASTAEDRGVWRRSSPEPAARRICPEWWPRTQRCRCWGFPWKAHALKGMDSLLSIVQMPGGVPVATFAIGKAGAINAALFAVAILSGQRPELREKLRAWRAAQTDRVLSDTLS